jgi:hypothetical protein
MTLKGKARTDYMRDYMRRRRAASKADGSPNLKNAKGAEPLRPEPVQQVQMEIDPSTLSMSAQQRLEATVRQHKRALDMQFEQRVSEEIRVRLEERVLPTMRKREAEYVKGINAHRGYITRDKFMTMWRCLHPDSRNSVSDRKLAEAFDILSGLERILVKRDERERMDQSHWTVEAMMSRREAQRERHKAKRTGSLRRR